MNTGSQSLFIEILPWLIPSVIIGFYILVKHRGSEFAKFAGLLSLKPIIATPLFFQIVKWYQDHTTGCDLNPLYLITLVPGLGITLLLVFYFREVVWDSRNKAMPVLLILDIVRWGNSVLLFSSCLELGDITPVLQAYLGLGMPTIFALVAFGLNRIHQLNQANTHFDSIS